MRIAAKISEVTIKFILKIIYEITKLFSIWYESHNFADGTAQDVSLKQCSEIVCPDCGSEEVGTFHFKNGFPYNHCYSCGNNWVDI